MAAILKLRRGTSIPSLVESELFFDTTNKTVVVGDGSTNHILVKIGANQGSISFSGDVSGSNLYLSGDITARDINARNVVLSGDIFLGDGNQSTDNIFLNASFSGSLLPDTTEVYTVGNENYKYKEIHVVSASIQNVSLPGTGILSSSLQDFDTYSSSIESQLDSVYTFTQSADQRLTSIEGFTQSVDLRVDSLELSQSYFDNTFSGSVDSRLVDAELTGSDHESRIDIIETTFSSSVDLRLDNLELTGSDHENRVIDLESTGSDHEVRITSIEGYSASLDSRLDNVEATGSDHESRLDIIETTFSSSVDLRLDDLESTGSDHETRLDTLETTFSSSVDLRLDDLESTGSDHESRLDEIETTFSSSVDLRLDLLETFSSSEYQADSSSFDSRLDVIETTFSTSVDLRLDDLESTGSDHESRLDTIEGPFSSSLDSRINSLNLYTQSTDLRLDDLESTGSDHESRLDIIEGPLSSSIDNQLNTIQSYTASLKNAIEVSGQNLTVFGDLVVEGTTTTINTQELLIEDKLLAIGSGSTTSTDADGGGFFISGADASILWNHLDQTLDFNTKVSSSVGFKGDGSELINIPSTGIVFDGSGVVSGSSQIDLTQTTNYVSGIKTRLNAEGIFSSSIQVNADDITNFDSNVKDKLDLDNIHSGSYLGTSTTSNLDEGINLYYTEARVKTRLNLEGVISGSSQIVDGSGIVSSSEQISNYGVFAELNGDNLVSGSSQIDLTQTTNYENGILDRLNVVGVFSGSDQVTSSLDLRYLEILGDSVVSGSSQIDLTQTTNYISGIKERLDNESVVSGSIQLTASLDQRYLQIEGDNVFSSSAQVDFTQISNKPSLVSGSAQITLSDTVGYNTFSSSLDSRLDLLEGDQHTHTNKVNLDTINQDLSTNDKPSFVNVNLPSLLSVPVGTEYSVLLYSQSGEITYSELGTSAYYHVSQSIYAEDDNVIGTAGAMKRYIDERMIEIGAGDITAVTATPGGGLSGGGLEGHVSFSLDTGSSHFTGGVISSLPSGLISGSSQIDLTQTTNYAQFSSSIDSRIFELELFSTSLDDSFVTEVELGTATSSLETLIQAKLNTSLYNTDSQSFDSRIDTLEGETHENPLTFTDSLTIDFTRSGDSISANAIGGIVSSSVQISEYNTFLEINGDNVVSGSSQVDLTQTTNYVSGIKDRLDLETVISGSDQVTASLDTRYLEINGDNVFSSSVQVNADTITNFDTNVKDKLNVEGIISGSDQVTASLDTRYLEINGDSVVSGSDQLTSSLDTRYLEINGDGVISGSSQVSADQTEGWAADVKTQLNANTVISGSSQVSADQTDGWVDDFKTQLNANTVISGSSQVQFNDIDGNPMYSGSSGALQYIAIQNQIEYILPESAGFTNLGHPSYPFKALYVSNNSIHIGDTVISRDETTGNIQFVDSGSGTPLSAEVDFTTIVNKPTLISESVQVNADTITNFDTNVKDKLNVEGVITGSDQLTGSLVDIASAQSISGTKTFEDIVVNGTGSFAYIQSVTGSAKIIGDAFIVVNNDTPTERYAGLSVYDSGSVSPTTASLFFDGQTNDWNYEYFEGGNVDFGVVMFGPEYNTKGSPTYLTNNRIPKGNGGHHLNDSNITDSGTLITLGSNVQVNGNIAVSGTVDGIDLQLLQLDVDVLYGKTLVSGSSQITMGGDLSGTANNAQIKPGVITNAEISSLAAISHTKLNLGGSLLVSGSGQITKSLQDVCTVGNTTNTTISITNGTASTSKTTGALVVTGGIGLGGSVFAGGDVVAYASSDQRLKDEITPIENSLQKINSIGGYSFVWNEKQDIYKGKDYGVIAQEIENILPELVETREDGYKAVKYDRIVSLLLEGIKELSKEVSELKEKIGK